MYQHVNRVTSETHGVPMEIRETFIGRVEPLAIARYDLAGHVPYDRVLICSTDEPRRPVHVQSPSVVRDRRYRLARKRFDSECEVMGPAPRDGQLVIPAEDQSGEAEGGTASGLITDPIEGHAIGRGRGQFW